MSRNLCQDTCPKCGYTFTLADFRGQPIEFRKYGPYAPTMGCKLTCQCGCVLFGYLRTDDKYWGDPWDAFEETLHFMEKSYPNEHLGKFAVMRNGQAEHTGYYQIDLSYYETYNDEGVGLDDPNPAHLFTGIDDPVTKWENHRTVDESHG